MHGVGSASFTGLSRAVETVLVLGMLPVVSAAQSPGKVRMISRVGLPVAVRDSLTVNGAVHLNAGHVDTVSGAQATLRVTPNDTYAVRFASRATFFEGHTELGDSSEASAFFPMRAHFLLPTAFLTTDTGATAKLTLLTVIYPGSALRYQSGKFRGSFLIGLTDAVNPSATLKLAQKVQFQFAAEDEDFDPSAIGVDHINLPFDSVKVEATNPGDSVRIHVIAQLDPKGADIWLHVSPALMFVNPPKQVEGLGLESAAVVIRVIGPRQSARVTFAPSAGSVDSTTMAVDANGTATVHLRSRGVGPARLTAVASGSTITLTLAFIFPWMFVLAALAGGVSGGGIKWLRASAPERSVARALVLGAGLGAAVALAYYVVRVNLLPFALDVPYVNEGAVFTLALLGGLFGVKPATA